MIEVLTKPDVEETLNGVLPGGRFEVQEVAPWTARIVTYGCEVPEQIKILFDQKRLPGVSIEYVVREWP